MDSRVTTGIDDLDRMLNGGIPEGNQVVVAGGPGAGKTLTSFEFCYKNAKAGIPSLFFALEESTSNIIKNAKKAFPDWTDIQELIDKRMLLIDKREIISAGMGDQLANPKESFKLAVAQIAANIKMYHIGRVVIDSVSTIKLLVGDPLAYRMFTLNMVEVLRIAGVTSLLTLEVENTQRDNMQFLPEFFMYDGIIFMYSTASEAERTPSIEVIKMRGSKHSFKTIPYEITSNGVKLLTIEGQDLEEI